MKRQRRKRMYQPITIETGIPIPPVRERKLGLIARLKTMKVGQSFLWRHGDMANMHGYAARAKIRITTRRVGRGKVKTLHRIWRIE